MQLTKTNLYQSGRIHMLPIERISPNPRQPRRHFPEQPLRELAESIRQHGVLQPLSVEKTATGYVLVAGERRLRAAGLAGLTHVPCILVRVTPQDSALLALVKNKLRLLRLSPACGELLRQYGLTERHARALLRLEDEESRLAALRHIGEKQLTVAATEEYIEAQLQKKQQGGKTKKPLYIIKDVRLFLNSVDRGMETIRRAGVDARFDRQDSEEAITITIQIPKQRATG